jgi:hypothetical protein
VVGIGLGQLGIQLHLEEGGDEGCQIQARWSCDWHRYYWYLRELCFPRGWGPLVSPKGRGVGPVEPPTVAPGLVAILLLPCRPAK